MFGIQKSGGQSLTSPRYNVCRYKDPLAKGSLKDIILCISSSTTIPTRDMVDKRKDGSLRIVDKQVLVVIREVAGGAGTADKQERISLERIRERKILR